MNTPAPWHANEDVYALAMAASARQTREALNKRRLMDGARGPTGGAGFDGPIAAQVAAAVANLAPGTKFRLCDVMQVCATTNNKRVREELVRLIKVGKITGHGHARMRSGTAVAPKSYAVPL